MSEQDVRNRSDAALVLMLVHTGKDVSAAWEGLYTVSDEEDDTLLLLLLTSEGRVVTQGSREV